MNKIFIGDSHIQPITLLLQQKYSKIYADKKWPDVEISTPGRSAYKLDYSELVIPDINDKIVIVLFGENDIRKHLPKYDNASSVVDAYVKKTKDTFINNFLLFIEPVPQVVNLNTKELTYSFESRLFQQQKFYKALSEHDINLIKTSEILGIDRLTESDTDDNQHLNKKYSYILSKHIDNMAKKLSEKRAGDQ